MAQLAYSRSGTGEPLVLLHGIGLSRRSWDPVIPTLAEGFDVIAVDLPGFGDSAALPPGIEPEPARLAAAVAGTLDELGVGAAHLAGNSLGGWVALELAEIRGASSVTLLSPAGLWRAGTPWYCRISLNASWWLSRHAGRILARAVGTRLGRAIVLGQTHGRPMHLTSAYARTAVRAMADGPNFDTTLRATADRHYRATRPIHAPVTVAFGTRDLILLRHQSRHLDQLPPGTRVGDLPGCGHVPMGDRPAAVAELIKQSCSVSICPERQRVAITAAQTESEVRPAILGSSK
jgi:pimeloyl-ACP methyl ester carboxylesterase